MNLKRVNNVKALSIHLLQIVGFIFLNTSIASANINASNGGCTYSCNSGGGTGSGCAGPTHAATFFDGCTIWLGQTVTATECNNAATASCGANNYITEQGSDGYPGVVASYDFSPGEYQGAMNGGWQNPYCTFTCTGVGSFCPATEPFIFEEISEPGQPLQCQHLNFTGSGYTCQQLADQACHQTVYHPSSGNDSGKVDINGELPPPPPPYVDPNPRGETVYQSFWWITNQNANGFQNQQFDPTQLTDPTIHFESIIGPQGETLDAVQYFNNMAVQQLINAKTKK